MRKKEHFTADYTKHFVMEELELIKGYKLTNETTETPNIIVNTIKIEINLSSDTGHEFYEEIKDKFTPEALNPKYISNSNYLYAESEKDDQKTIEIKILTNRHDPMDMKAKKKLLYRINKYT